MTSRDRPRRVLVVGWGFLGAAVGRRLREEGMQVLTLTRSESARTQAARRDAIEAVIGDASDASVLVQAITDVDHVVCAAGGLLPPVAADLPLDDASATLSPLLAVLERLRTRRSVGLTYLSSGGTVYGNPSRLPASEGDPARPISSYGVSRLAGELYAELYARTYGVPVQILRLSNVYGPGQSPERGQGVVATFLHRVASGLPLAIVGDGSAIRDYVYVSDVADVVARLVGDWQDVGIANVGSGVGISVLDLVRVIGETLGVEPIVNFLPARPHDVAAITLDIARLRSVIDYRPIDLRRGLQLTWQYILAGQRPTIVALGLPQPPLRRVMVEAAGLETAEAAP